MPMRINHDGMFSLAVGGLLAIAVSQGIGRFVYTPILPFMAADLGLGGSAAGLIASANFVGYLLGAMLASIPNLPGSRRRWMLGGLLVSALTTGAIGLCSSTVSLAATRFVGGFTSAIVLIYASALVLDRLNLARRGDLSAVHFAGVGFGICVSSAVVAVLVLLDVSWRVQWFTAAILSALALLVVVRLVPEPPAGSPLVPAPGEVAQATVMSGSLLRMVLAYGLLGFGYVVTGTFLIAIVRRDPSTQALASWIWPLTGLAAIPAVAIWNRVARGVGVYRAYALASLAEAIGVVASVVWPGPGGAILAALLLGGTFIGLTSLGFVGARNLSTADPRRVIGLMTAVFGIGQIVGPAFGGIAFDLTGSYLLPSLVAAATLVIGALLTWSIRAPRPA
jgi:predicted MFS family arabinose efflux permease